MNRVLIVDDEQISLDVTAKMVNACGFQPIPTYNSENAIELWKKERPGLCLLDLQLNDINMDGIALCSWIRDKDPSVVMIAMSGYFFSHFDREYCRGAGFSDFLEKPIHLADMCDALHGAQTRKARWDMLKNETRRP